MGADVLSRVPVLVVDDDGTIRESVRAMLEVEGYAVAGAETAGAALDYLRAAPAGHVVLLDYLLLRGEGGAVQHAVEGDAGLRRHCYVLLTAAQASDLAADEQRLVAALCAGILRKPFDLDDLLRAVADAAAGLRANP